MVGLLLSRDGDANPRELLNGNWWVREPFCAESPHPVRVRPSPITGRSRSRRERATVVNRPRSQAPALADALHKGNHRLLGEVTSDGDLLPRSAPEAPHADPRPGRRSSWT